LNERRMVPGGRPGKLLWAIETTRKKDVLQWICLDIIEEGREESWRCGSAAVSDVFVL
jgi:hypothetical protein